MTLFCTTRSWRHRGTVTSCVTSCHGGWIAAAAGVMPSAGGTGTLSGRDVTVAAPAGIAWERWKHNEQRGTKTEDKLTTELLLHFFLWFSETIESAASYAYASIQKSGYRLFILVPLLLHSRKIDSSTRCSCCTSHFIIAFLLLFVCFFMLFKSLHILLFLHMFCVGL